MKKCVDGVGSLKDQILYRCLLLIFNLTESGYDYFIRVTVCYETIVYSE